MTARVAGLLEEGTDFDALDVAVSQRFSSEGSFAKGEAMARVHDLEVAVHLVGRALEALGLAPGRPVYAVIKSIAFDHHAFAGALPPTVGADADTRHG